MKDFPCVPVDRIPAPWSVGIAHLQEPVWLANIPINPSSVTVYLTDHILWSCALHWFYKKKYDHKHKIPFSRAIKNDLEPLGEILRSTLELIQELSFFSGVNGVDWFVGASKELREILFDGTGGKPQAVKRVQAITTGIKAIIEDRKAPNPFSKEQTPYLWKTIEACRSIMHDPQRRYPAFVGKYLQRESRKTGEKGFVNALSSWSTHLKKSSKMQVSKLTITEDRHCLTEQIGRGGHTQTVPQDVGEKLISTILAAKGFQAERSKSDKS